MKNSWICKSLGPKNESWGFLGQDERCKRKKLIGFYRMLFTREADMRDNSLISFMQVEYPTVKFDVPHKISWTLCTEQVIDSI